MPKTHFYSMLISLLHSKNVCICTQKGKVLIPLSLHKTFELSLKRLIQMLFNQKITIKWLNINVLIIQ